MHQLKTHPQVVQKPQQKQSKTYQKVNAYSKKPALEQVLVLIFMVVLIVLHSVFIVPPIVAVIKHAVLIFLLSLHYCLLLIVLIDYLILTIKDPVDSLVEGSTIESLQNPQELRYCEECAHSKFIKSYHCRCCNRCTENFDHHCRYLNNCVGGKNYESFFRLLVVLTLFFVNVIVQSIWVFVESYSSQDMKNYMISRWPVLIVGILVCILILGVDSLLIYHVYLNFVRKMTTVQYIFRDTPSNESVSNSTQNIQSSQQNMQKGDRI